MIVYPTNKPYHHTIVILTDISLCACSVGTSLASQSSHLEIASFYYLRDLSSGSLFSLFFLAFSVLFPFFLLSLCVRACTPSTAPRACPAPSRVSAGAGGQRGGCEERGRRFSSLGVPCDSRHEGSMHGLCLASIYRIRVCTSLYGSFGIAR